MPNPLPSDQRRFAAESPFDAAFGYGSAPISTPTSEGRHDSSQTAGRAADEDGLQPADTPAELTGPVWVVDDDDVRESLTFALQPRFEAASCSGLIVSIRAIASQRAARTAGST